MAHVSDHARIRAVLGERGVGDLRQRPERVGEQQPVKAVVGDPADLRQDREPLLPLGRLLGGRGVAVEDLLAVGAAGFGAAVGMKEELPAVAVDADVVVELADQDKVVH
jgi:hypothetical protein